MVIVLGSPTLARAEAPPGHRATGLAARIARSAVAAGARVEIVGKVGDDDAGDMVAVDLERAGVGHAALLRDPAVGTPLGERGPTLPLEPADLELALRYLADFRVLVASEPLAASLAQAVAEAARFAGAHRVLIGGAPEEGDDVTQLEASGGDHAAFAGFVGRYAALLDAGRDPGEAFGHAANDVGWQPARGA